ncbi:MAG: DUF4358 domain-containing protein [Lachnospiraceae bacterium]|nr:DUF4358 domain-containing protein [Lachnospiraceae bacterium]
MKKTNLYIGLLELGKLIPCVCVLVLLVGLLSSGKVSNTGIEAMTEQVVAQADLSHVQLADNQMVKRLYGIDPSAYDGITLYYPISNMDADEIFLIRLADVSQQETVKQAIDARLETQLASFDGYGVDQYETLEKSVVVVQGNYILWVSAADTEPIVRAFKEGL